MSKFLNTTTQTIAWFKKSNESGELEMKPPFQRNPVWTLPQKSYLIDSILNGFPVPEIYMQEYIDETGKERHVVIDGQQRLRACLEFLEGRFEISSDESPSWGGMKFDELSPDEKRRVFGYKFIVRQLPEMSDEDIRGIFQRLNKNVVALNAQELRQATYWGPFLRTMQEVANYGYWSTTGIFTPLNTRRMLDIEYVSELAVAILHGHQNKKETLDQYYATYEEEFDQKEELVEKFRRVIYELEQLLPDIKNTRWRKKSDFYSLFLLLSEKAASLPLSTDQRAAARISLDSFAAKVNKAVSGQDEDTLTDSERSYVRSIRASSDIGNRKRRHESLELLLAPVFNPVSGVGGSVPIQPLAGGLFEDNTPDEATTDA